MIRQFVFEAFPRCDFWSRFTQAEIAPVEPVRGATHEFGLLSDEDDLMNVWQAYLASKTAEPPALPVDPGEFDRLYGLFLA